MIPGQLRLLKVMNSGTEFQECFISSDMTTFLTCSAFDSARQSLSAMSMTQLSASLPIVLTNGIVSINPATISSSGSLSASDKLKLDNMQTAVVSVSGGIGRVTWQYPIAYSSGVVPIIECVPVKPTGSFVGYNATLYGDPTNVSCSVEVNTINPTIIGILGSILIAQPAPNGTKVHLTSRLP